MYEGVLHGRRLLQRAVQRTMPILQVDSHVDGDLLDRPIRSAARRTPGMHHRWTLRRRVRRPAGCLHIRHRRMRHRDVQLDEQYAECSHLQRRSVRHHADGVSEWVRVQCIRD